MKLLVLGGTIFVGRAIVDEAIERGHDVTVFHRGQRGGDLFGNRVDKILGDRDGELEKLGDQRWDAVIDTCGYVPRIVGQSCDHLKHLTNRYLFISTISVYDTAGQARIDETSPLATMLDETTEVVDGDTYGPLKALCELEVSLAFAERSLLIRPGLIFGPNDPTDRFPYWIERMARGGTVLAPDCQDQPLQFIDARDLASFCLSSLESGLCGKINATGPNAPYTLGHVIETCRELINPTAKIEWIDPMELEDAGVKPWTDLPLYLGMPPSPDEADSHLALMNVDVTKALAHGLAQRSLEDTIRDTDQWCRTRQSGETKVGLSAEREAELLRDLLAVRSV